jgi:uncharacterized protein (DUF2147 family)
MVRPLSLAALAVATMVLTPGAALAADPNGIWLSADGDVKMKVAPCGGAICSTVSWLKSPNDEAGKPKFDKNNPDAAKRSRPIVGSQIIVGMKPDGANSWSGQIYNAEDGKTYSGSFTLTGANSAEIKGCLAIFCKTKAWARSH